MRKKLEGLIAENKMGIAFLTGPMSHLVSANMDVLAELNHPIPTLSAVSGADYLTSTERYPWFQRTSTSDSSKVVIYRKFV
jgi:hypothetical protein